MGASGLGATSPVSWNLNPTGDGPRRSVQRNPAHLVYARAPSQRSTREGGQVARHQGARPQARQLSCSSTRRRRSDPSNPTGPLDLRGHKKQGRRQGRRQEEEATGSGPSRADMTRVASIARENEHAPVRGRCNREEKKRKKGEGAKQQTTTRTARARLG